MGTTFLCFHSLSQDLWGSRLMGDLNHLNKTSWRWADTTQEVPGDEECAPPPSKNLFPIFHGCLTINHNHISLLLFLFLFLVQPSMSGTNHRKNRTPPLRGWTAVAWYFPMNWLHLPPWWDETNISESRGAVCEVLFSKCLRVCARIPANFTWRLKYL